jgi:hypothetical protein
LLAAVVKKEKLLAAVVKKEKLLAAGRVVHFTCLHQQQHVAA